MLSSGKDLFDASVFNVSVRKQCRGSKARRDLPPLLPPKIAQASVACRVAPSCSKETTWTNFAPETRSLATSSHQPGPQLLAPGYAELPHVRHTC